MSVRQNAEVMPFVTQRYVGESPHGYFILIGDAAAHPGVAIEAPEQMDRGASHAIVFVKNLAELHRAVGRVLRSHVLVITGYGIHIVAGEKERSKSENSFRIDQVPDNFLDGPLVRCVTERRFCFIEPAQQNQGLLPLFFERGNNIGLTDEIHIAAEVRGMFGRFGTADPEMCHRWIVRYSGVFTEAEARRHLHISGRRLSFRWKAGAWS